MGLRRIFSPLTLVGLLLFVGCDLASKKVATDRLNFHPARSSLAGLTGSFRDYPALYDRADFIPVDGNRGDLARFELFFNTRQAFSIGPELRGFGILFTALAIVFLILVRLRMPHFGHGIAWTLVFAGALGNFIDKLFVKSLITREWVFSWGPLPGHASGVVDFISVVWFGLERFDFFPLRFLSWERWPIFNVADSMLVIGALLLGFSLFQRSPRQDGVVPDESALS